jgi:hypothetical protein
MDNEPDREAVGRLLADSVEPCMGQPNLGNYLPWWFEVDHLVQRNRGSRFVLYEQSAVRPDLVGFLGDPVETGSNRKGVVVRLVE